MKLIYQSHETKMLNISGINYSRMDQVKFVEDSL